jgi:hypothetical protein
MAQAAGAPFNAGLNVAPPTMYGAPMTTAQLQPQPQIVTYPGNQLQNDMFNSIDMNHDGMISRQEFQAAMR